MSSSSGSIQEQERGSHVPFVGIAIVVNDSVPFRYPLECDAAAFRDEDLNCIRLRKARTNFWRITKTTFAELFLPSNSEDFFGDNLELVVDSLRLVYFPVKTTDIVKNSSVVSLSVVLALDASMDTIVEQSRAKLRVEPSPTAYGHAFSLSLAGIRPYRMVAKELANALLFAESVDSYVSRETKLALEESQTSLQSELRVIYHDLVKRGTAEFRHRDRLWASLSLLDPKLKPTMEIRPYHSVVIVRDFGNDVRKEDDVPVKVLRTYFAEWGAMRSLQEAADDLEMSLDQTLRFASYLRQWEGARIVHKLQDFSMFLVSPECDLKRTNPLVQRFAATFPGKDVANVLSQVTVPNPGTKIPRRLKDFSALYGDQTRPIFSWLLRHGLILEVFQFIYFIPSSSVSRASSRRGSFNAGSEPVSPVHVPASQNVSAVLGLAGNNMMPQPSPSPQASQSSSGTASQRSAPTMKMLNEYVDTKGMTSAQVSYLKTAWDLSNPVFRAFLKISHLFGGTNHIQEILFQSGMSTGALKIVLEQYSDCLFVALHEL